MLYPVFVNQKSTLGYRVVVPDLPGCFSSGNTIEKAVQNTRAAILCHLEELFLERAAIPFQKSVEHHLENPEFKNAILAFVEVNTSEIFNEAKSE